MVKSFLRQEYTEGIVLQADKDVFGVRCVSWKCHVGNTRLEPKGNVRSGDSSKRGALSVWFTTLSVFSFLRPLPDPK